MLHLGVILKFRALFLKVNVFTVVRHFQWIHQRKALSIVGFFPITVVRHFQWIHQRKALSIVGFFPIKRKYSYFVLLEEKPLSSYHKQ